VEQFLRCPRLCPEQVVLEGVEERENSFQQAGFDGFVRQPFRIRARGLGIDARAFAMASVSAPSGR
jgi:hypothetical protein